MLAQCVELCPDAMWREGEHPRSFWRVVFHAAFFTHLYLGQDEAAFEPWPGRRANIHHRLWESPADVEPFELPEDAAIYHRDEMLDYIRHLDTCVDALVERLDLDADTTGFAWYPSMRKLPHLIMNLRHLQGHVGQLSERLMARGIDIDWKG